MRSLRDARGRACAAVVFAASLGSAACGGSSAKPWDRPSVVLRPGPVDNPLPTSPTPAPPCVKGRLVEREEVCGLGVMGPAYRWDDPNMRARAQRRAAASLAGMLRSLVTTALVVGQSEESYWSRRESYVEIDEALIDRIERAAEHEIWFDLEGTGPVRREKLTYACACMSASAAGIRIDAEQAAEQAFSRVHAAEEVPSWIADPKIRNSALECAVGFYPRRFYAEDMLADLANSVREQLVQKTRSWVLSEFDERTVCARRTEAGCRTTIESLVEAANEGVSRGVALTSVWFDTLGLGPDAQKMSAYGWGCVFDESVLEAARRRLREIRGPDFAAPIAGID